jgi:hypothetical protein
LGNLRHPQTCQVGRKVIAQAEISSGGDVNYDAARQLLALWRPAMPEVKVGAPPVATEERETEKAETETF